LDELVGHLLVGDDDGGLDVVAGAEDGPVQGGAAVLVSCFDGGAVGQELFRFGEVGQDVLLFGVAGRLVELLDEWRGVRRRG
jgi:hypothetical protein